MPSSTDPSVIPLAQRANELALKNRAIDEAPIGITIADMTLEDYPVVYANEGFERITGYSQEEILGRNCRFLQGEATAEEPIDAMREAIDAGESVEVELRNYRKDGTQFWNQVTLAPISGDGGEIAFYLGFQQDVTDRKESERRLERQRDDLDLLNQLLRHDIRNDLQLVLGYLELLEEHVDDDGRDHLETVLENTRHAVELTATAGEMAEVMLREEVEPETVSLRDRLRAPIEEVRSAYPDATIRVEGDLPTVAVQADRLLESVFDNLLQNAVQHNDTDRPEVTVSVECDAGDAIVHIADNGPGIPDEMKREVFGRTEKGTDSQGTGIGLYLVDALVEEYGGSVWIEDNEPEGSVFVVRLPIAE